MITWQLPLIKKPDVKIFSEVCVGAWRLNNAARFWTHPISPRLELTRWNTDDWAAKIPRFDINAETLYKKKMRCARCQLELRDRDTSNGICSKRWRRTCAGFQAFPTGSSTSQITNAREPLLPRIKLLWVFESKLPFSVRLQRGCGSSTFLGNIRHILYLDYAKVPAFLSGAMI